MKLTTVRVEKPPPTNFILGLAQGARIIEDVHLALERIGSGFPFGIGFCEAAGNRLVRCAGTDQGMIDLARRNAAAIGAGDTFLVFFGSVNPDQVLAAIKALSEVCAIYCATANPAEVVLASSDQGRGIVSVIDGFGPKGVESSEETAWRENYLHHTSGFGRLDAFSAKPR